MELEGVRVVHRGADASVFELPAALPRLYVPRHVTIHADAAAAVAAGRALADFAEAATAVAAPGAGLAAGTSVANPASRVEDLHVAGRRIRARVVAPGPTLVASSQPAIPGWRVEVDGERVEPLSIHGAFLGIAVPAGEHRVEMVYAPVSWRVGLGLAVLGVVLGGLLWWRGGVVKPTRLTDLYGSLQAPRSYPGTAETRDEVGRNLGGVDEDLE
jgi:hypothetical protein